MTKIINHLKWPNISFQWKQEKIACKEERRVACLLQETLHKEQALAKQALANPSRRYPIAVIGGGAVGVLILALQGISVFKTCAVVLDVLVGVGLLGGVLNFKEGALAIEEGIRAWKNEDKRLAIRLLMQGVLSSSLGGAMIVFSIARILVISSIVAVFAANPYILPTLFFLLALFLLIETSHRFLLAIQKKDLGSRLHLPKLCSTLNNSPQGTEAAVQWARSKLEDCFQGASHEELRKKIQKALNTYKAEIGFIAAMEVFRLFEMILERKEKKEILQQIKRTENKISRWNQTLYFKLLSVLLCGGGFAAGMSAIALDSSVVDGVQDLVMSIAGVVPLTFDIAFPFEREIPIVIDPEQEFPPHTMECVQNL